MRASIDLNCDLGEDPAAVARDEELLSLISSANVACGGHAGDTASMAHFARAARLRNVALGAHPGYPDREHFGRRDLGLTADEIAGAVESQLTALRDIAAGEGVALSHVKPHGALYNRAASDPSVAAAIAEGVRRVDPRLPIYGLAGSPALEIWRRVGLRAVAEAFADRRYEADGTLRPRRHADALILDPGAAAAQAIRLAAEDWIEPHDGGRLTVEVETICIHADTPGAPAIARSVRAALAAAGIAVGREGIIRR